MDTNTPTTGQFRRTQLPTFTTAHWIFDIYGLLHRSRSGNIHPASTQPAHDTEPDDNTPESGIP